MSDSISPAAIVDEDGAVIAVIETSMKSGPIEFAYRFRATPEGPELVHPWRGDLVRDKRVLTSYSAKICGYSAYCVHHARRSFYIF